MGEKNERFYKGFYRAAKKVVNSYWLKRKLKGRTFTDDEIAQILELDGFLRFIFPKTKTNNGSTFINITAKYALTIKGKRYEQFIDKFIELSELDYKKDKLTVAKGLYLLCQDRRCEVYVSVSNYTISRLTDSELIKRGYSQGKKLFLPKRSKNSCVLSSILYVDCDLDEEHNSYDDSAMVEWVYVQCPFLKELNPCIIRSGGGLHIWIPIKPYDTLYYEHKCRWELTEEKFLKACAPIMADMKAKDITRLLRVPFSFNRKPKYKEPFKVHTIAYPNYEAKRMSLAQINALLDEYVNESEAYFDDGFVEVSAEELLSENIVPIVNEKNIKNIIFVKSEAIDIDEAIDKGLVSLDAPSSKVKKDTAERSESKTSKNILPSDYEFDEVTLVKNLKIAHDMEEDHRLRDIVFYLLNRKSIGLCSEGVRHRLLWQFAYCLYNAKVSKKSDIYKELDWLNSLFVDSLSHKEIEKEKREIYKTLVDEERHIIKHMKNITLDKLVSFTEQEKLYAFGNYSEEGSQAYREKFLQKLAKNTLTLELRKRPSRFDERAWGFIKMFQSTDNDWSHKYWSEHYKDKCDYNTFKRYRDAYKEAEELKPMINYPIAKATDGLIEQSIFIRNICALKSDISYLAFLWIAPNAYIRKVMFEYVQRFNRLVSF